MKRTTQLNYDTFAKLVNGIHDSCESYFIRYMKAAYESQSWFKDSLSAYVKAHGFDCCSDIVTQAFIEELDEYDFDNPDINVFIKACFKEGYNKIVNN